MTYFNSPLRSRNALIISLSFLACLLRASVGVTVPAHAWTPASIPAATGDQATVKTSITHSPDAPTANQSVNYTGKIELTNLLGGADNTVDIEITSDSQAPFTADPSFSGGNVTKVSGPAAGSAGIYKYRATNLSAGNVTLTFTAPATYKPGSDGGVFNASVHASVTTTSADMALTPNSQTFTADSGTTCSGTLTGTFTVGKAGGWLMDTKYADVKGKGNILFDDKNMIQFGGNSNNSMTVIDASGKDISGTLGQHNPVYRANDPTPPDEQISAYNDPKSFPNIKWIDSMNWNFDASTMTGDTWLPAGSKITLKRHAVFTDCYRGPVKAPTVQNYLDTVGMTVGVSRLNSVVAQDDAATSFGKTAVVETTCDAVYSTDSGKGLTIRKLDVTANPVTVKGVASMTKGNSDTGAISKQFPSR